MSDPIVTIAHLRQAGMCNRQPRLWFDRHGLSWSTFVTEGYPASVLEATGDALAQPVIDIARREADGV